MKEKLIEKYGEKQAEILLAKFTEDEIYENGFIEKELPEDPQWQSKFLELEKRLKETEKLLQDKDNHISKLNEENKNKRLNLENEKLTKEELQAKLIEVETKLNDYESKLENYKDYDQLKGFYEAKSKQEQEHKQKLLEKVEESKREALSKLDISEIEMFINNDVPSETPGINNQQAPIDAYDSGIKSLINAFKIN